MSNVTQQTNEVESYYPIILFVIDTYLAIIHVGYELCLQDDEELGNTLVSLTDEERSRMLCEEPCGKFFFD